MRLRNSFWATFAPALGLIACGSIDGIDNGRAAARERAAQLPPAPPPEAVKLGDPYQVAGQTIVPKDEVGYDEVGYASWYGDELRGQPTGNGETFNPDGASAAHRTLPMPSYVEVTDLNSGRTILVRINDRGPYKKDRIIDLSAGAARQLGVEGQGAFPVRVRRVNPPEYERNNLRNGGTAVERLATPPGLLNALRAKLKDQPVPRETADAAPMQKPAKPASPLKTPPMKPAPKPPVAPAAGAEFPAPDQAPAGAMPTDDDRFVTEEAGARPSKPARPAKAPPPAPPAPAQPQGGAWFVQVGAFSNGASARALAQKAGAQAVQAGSIWRVRAGPYASESAARQALGGWRSKGYRDARVSR